MPEPDSGDPDTDGRRHVIRAREDVVVTSAPDLAAGEGKRTYYIKINPTGEIFEFGEDEYAIWKQFQGGTSLEEAQEAIAARFGTRLGDRLRGFVSDLAMRGLLGGDLPPDLVEDYRREAQLRWRPFLVEPAPGERKTPPHTPFRLVLGDPNAFFGFLARCFGWMRYLRWPLAVGGMLSLMIIFKHAQIYAADFHSEILQWGRIPHAVLTMFTVNLTRVIAQGAVSRYYGARVRYMSVDLVYGVWPRFHEDKKGILLLERTPQLWSHATPFFSRLSYFVVGTLGWWWFRGNGSNLSSWCLLLSQAAIVDFATAALPMFKNETYFWFSAFNRDPVLQDRGFAALRSLFMLPKGLPRHLSSTEKLALTLYGLSILIAFVVVIMTVITFLVGLTASYNGFGFCIALLMVLLGFAKVMTIRSLKRQLLLTRADRRAVQRAYRRGERGNRFAPAAQEAAQ
jgi:hypothetical protein